MTVADTLHQAVLNGDVETVITCARALGENPSERNKAVHNDAQHGYIGTLLERVPPDRMGGWSASMSQERRKARLRAATLLLDMGCSAHPLQALHNSSAAHPLVALLRFPNEFEVPYEGEEDAEIELCQRLLDNGAVVNFEQKIDKNPFCLAERLLMGNRLKLLEHVKALHALGQYFSAEDIAAIGREWKESNGRNPPKHLIGSTSITLNLYGNGLNSLHVLAVHNGLALPNSPLLHTLIGDEWGIVVGHLLNKGFDPLEKMDGQTVLERWLHTMLFNDMHAYIPNGQFAALLRAKPETVLQHTEGKRVGWADKRTQDILGEFEPIGTGSVYAVYGPLLKQCMHTHMGGAKVAVVLEEMENALARAQHRVLEQATDNHGHMAGKRLL